MYTLRTKFECGDRGRRKRLHVGFICPRAIGKLPCLGELPAQEIVIYKLIHTSQNTTQNHNHYVDIFTIRNYTDSPLTGKYTDSTLIPSDSQNPRCRSIFRALFAVLLPIPHILKHRFVVVAVVVHTMNIPSKRS